MNAISVNIVVFLTCHCIKICYVSGAGNFIYPSFGFQVTGQAFQGFWGIPWRACIEKCKAIRKCQRVNYFSRMSGLCELFDANDNAYPVIELKEGVMFASKSDWEDVDSQHCETCDDSEMCTETQEHPCHIIACPVLNPAAGAKLLGNQNNVGSKQLYICKNGEKRIVTCSEAGSWSDIINIECICKLPNIDHASLDVKEFEDAVEVVIVCDDGCVHVGTNKTRCSGPSHEWAELNMVGCLHVFDEPWTLVYAKINGGSGSIYDSWLGESTDSGDFRNNEVLADWKEQRIVVSQVKVEIMDFSGNIVKTLIFNGMNTNDENWFSQGRLIESSWTDLLSVQSPDIFGITGKKIEITDIRPELQGTEVPLRWAILDYETDNGKNVVDCVSGKLWLATMHSGRYPCENIGDVMGATGHAIVFSSSTTGTTWNGGQAELAKMILVYVQIQA